MMLPKALRCHVSRPLRGVQAWGVGGGGPGQTLAPGPQIFPAAMLHENQEKGMSCFPLVSKAVET